MSDEQTLDSIFMQDYQESMTGISRFSTPADYSNTEVDPLSVSMEGIKMPEDDSVGGFLHDWMKTSASMTKGAFQAGAGTPGDLESLGRGLWEGLMNQQEGESFGDAFMRGLAGSETILPTTEDVKASGLLPEVSGGSEDAEMIGEFLPPGVMGKKAIDVGKKVLKKAKK